jgi:hypothetical protein
MKALGLLRDFGEVEVPRRRDSSSVETCFDCRIIRTVLGGLELELGEMRVY